MNNNIKLLVSVQGIEGGIQKLSGTTKEQYRITKRELYEGYEGKDKNKVVLQGHYMKNAYETVPVTQEIKMTQDAYDYMTSSERPYWLPRKYNWVSLTKRQRLEMHLQRTCESLGGKSFTYHVLDD